MSLAFIATMAQEESHTKSAIMNASIEMRFAHGIFLTPPLLGYDNDEEGQDYEEINHVRVLKKVNGVRDVVHRQEVGTDVLQIHPALHFLRMCQFYEDAISGHQGIYLEFCYIVLCILY